MSRIGRRPINLPEKVKVELRESSIYIEGPKGRLSLNIPFSIEVKIQDGKINIERKSEDKKTKSLHGTVRALIENMVVGVSKGFKKELEIVGTGYKAQMKANTLILQVGFSHPVQMPVPQDLKVSVSGTNKIMVEGPDKQRVGHFAAQIRGIYPPEPYKGKGIRYVGEVVRKKLGKALAK
jgi:large subunit ribosomal protein L6